MTFIDRWNDDDGKGGRRRGLGGRGLRARRAR